MNIPQIILPNEENDISEIINVRILLRPIFSSMKTFYEKLHIFSNFSTLKYDLIDFLDHYQTQRKNFIHLYQRLSIVQDCEILYDELYTDFIKALEIESFLITQKEIDEFEKEIIDSISNCQNIFMCKLPIEIL